MRNRLLVVIFIASALIFGALFAREVLRNRSLPREKFIEKKLRVLTYSTFVGSAGPGADILQRFKKEHGCEVEVLTAGDAGLILERLKIAQASAPFDVVIGLDQLLLTDALREGGWKKFALDSATWNPAVRSDNGDFFVPFDWSPMTFVYRQGEGEPPQKFDDLALPKFKTQFALQDPRASSSGLQFFDWVKAIKGEQTVDFLARFKPNVQSISPSWSFSYGLFKKKQAQFVFSYLTSLAFHWGTEKDRAYQVVSFPEGHPVQIEYAGVPEGCRECELGQEFVRTLLEPWAQKLIMTKNFMLPVVMGTDVDSIFSELPQLELRPGKPPAAKDLSDWDKVFKR